MSIADRSIEFIDANGVITQATISIDAPRLEAEWVCDVHVRCDGKTKTFPIRGEDALQSLNLALSFIPSAVQGVEKELRARATWNGGPVFVLGQL